MKQKYVSGQKLIELFVITTITGIIYINMYSFQLKSEPAE